MKINLILAVLLTISLNAKDYKNINLSDFVQILSQTTNKNIVMSDSIKKDFHIYLPSYDFKNKKVSVKLLKNILKINNLTTKTVDNVILIYKPKPVPAKVKKEPEPPKETLHVIKYKYLNKDDIKTYLASLYPNTKNTILKNRLLIYTDKDKYNEIKEQIKSLDGSFLQRNIQLTIVSTVNKDEKDIGLDFKALHFDATKYIELLTSKVSFNTSLTNTNQFYAFINLMRDKGYTKLLDNPNITLSDKKDAIIESTQNIPYLTTSTSTKDTTTTKQDSYDYKDVGLKVNFTNVVITESHIDVDLDIYIQSILESSITPTIGSRHIKTHITLDKNSSIVLGGLNSKLNYRTTNNIPIVEYVPVLNQLSKHEVSNVQDETFTIILSN